MTHRPQCPQCPQGPRCPQFPQWPHGGLFRGLTLFAMLAVFMWSGCASEHVPADPGSGGLEQVLFATPPDSSVACFRIPAIETAGGVLLAAIDERVPSCADLRGNRDINIVVRRSMDDGLTWTAPERAIDYPDGVSASDPSFIVDHQQERVFMLVNVMDHDRAPQQYRFHVLSSDDAGASWSEPVDITDQVAPPSWQDDFMFVTSGRGVQASDGTLLHTIVNLQRGVHVLASDDHGASWHLADAPITPGDESKIVELADGSWMVNSRVAGAGHRWVHRSTDRGASWQSSPDSSLIDPAVNASLVRVGPRLIYTGAHHPTDRTNLMLRVSEDEGQTWSKGELIEAGSAAYVSSTALDDSTFALFYERAGYTENVFKRLRIPTP